MSEKPKENDTSSPSGHTHGREGIAIRFLRQFDITPDPHPTRICDHHFALDSYDAARRGYVCACGQFLPIEDVAAGFGHVDEGR